MKEIDDIRKKYWDRRRQPIRRCKWRGRRKRIEIGQQQKREHRSIYCDHSCLP